MHARQVVALEEIVDVDLPVAADLVADATLEAIAREVVRQPRIDAIDEVGERHRRLQRREYQTLPLGHLRLRQSDGRDVKAGGIVHLRRAAQPSVERIGPAVVAAHQRPRAATIAFGERASAVATDIVQRAQPSLLHTGFGLSAHDK